MAAAALCSVFDVLSVDCEKRERKKVMLLCEGNEKCALKFQGKLKKGFIYQERSSCCCLCICLVKLFIFCFLHIIIEEDIII